MRGIAPPLLVSGGGGGSPTLPAVTIGSVALALTGENLLDESPYEWTLPSTGDISASATQFKFGSKALYQSSAGPLGRAYAQLPLFFVGDTTLGFWVRPSTVSANQCVIGQRHVASSGDGWEVILASDGSFYIQTISSNTPSAIQTAAGVLAANVWQHIFVVYSGGTIYLFLNGLLLTSGAISLTTYSAGNTGAFSIGARPNSSLPLTGGYVDDVFLTHEVLTTSTFAAPTTALIPAFPSGYSTWNNSDKGSGLVVSAGSRNASSNGTVNSIRGTQGRAVGTSRYLEFTFGGGNSNADNVALAGLGNSSATLSSYPGADVNGWAFYPGGPQAYNNNGAVSVGSNVSTFGIWLTAAGGFRVKTSGTDPTTDAFSGLTGTLYPMWGQGSGAGSRECALNTGGSAWKLGLPSGATAWG